jgi:tRNA (guanine26-N2/guanine27-N2)-dimethyltransferase
VSLKLIQIVEGETKFYVPASSLIKKEPDTYPVFFNPAAKINRDISIALTRVIGGRTYCDALAGLGARGIRISNEASSNMEVSLNDFNSNAISLAKKNAKINSVIQRCRITQEEANQFLYSRFGRDEKFDFIDIDPFGTPVPYLQAAIVATSDGGVISVTATDTAVLCGVYPLVSLRRYGSVSARSDFRHETAIRILLNFCARTAAMSDAGIEAIAAHSTRHYIRIYIRIRRSAQNANNSIKSFGYVTHCSICSENSVSTIFKERCNRCGSKVGSAGPLWTGAITDQSLILRAKDICDKMNFKEGAGLLASLNGVNEHYPFSYSLEEICSRLKLPSVSFEIVKDRLSSLGFMCMKQPFEKSGIKTNASYDDLMAVVNSIQNNRDR